MSKNTFLYKGDKAELHEESDVEALLAGGWFDNPADALAADGDTPAEDEGSPEAATAESEPEENKTLLGSIKDAVGIGGPDEKVEEGSDTEPEG